MSETTMISGLLDDLRKGDQEAFARLVPVVYVEMRRLAARYMRRERSGQSLQTSDLVHEAYLRLAGREEKNWQNRAHFFAIAAHAMRSILVDHARARHAKKRGGSCERLEIDGGAQLTASDPDNLILLDEALGRLAEIDQRQSKIVELRHFAGMSVEEVAAVFGVSERTILREWKIAKAWLHAELLKTATP
ncbi:MAG TPA: ECF-type sigma factor [Acidobacteriota bacterium]|nr:ECF-type sigma factor [Acidobacteriota bacterium]